MSGPKGSPVRIWMVTGGELLARLSTSDRGCVVLDLQMPGSTAWRCSAPSSSARSQVGDGD